MLDLPRLWSELPDVSEQRPKPTSDVGNRTTDGDPALTLHRGKATWGERLVPLDEFRRATASHGQRLAQEERLRATDRYLQRHEDPTPVEGPFSKVAVFGGVYSNLQGLEALVAEASDRGIEQLYCLGDLGGFGPHPERIWQAVKEASIACVQGNYEESLASGRDDCNCGYTDPRDNHFAELSYRYTAHNCSPEFKTWMGRLPVRRRIRVGARKLLLVHGSPREVNEFLFDSTTPAAFLEVILDQENCDGFLCTHTGLPWHRRLPSGRDVVNVGAVGRPANDGDPRVRYCVLEDRGDQLGVEILKLEFDYESLAEEMRAESLPEEFVETILSGWWTTCLEILPAKERAASRL